MHCTHVSARLEEKAANLGEKPSGRMHHFDHLAFECSGSHIGWLANAMVGDCGGVAFMQLIVSQLGLGRGWNGSSRRTLCEHGHGQFSEGLIVLSPAPQLGLGLKIEKI